MNNNSANIENIFEERTPEKKELKPGYRTTEFWLSTVACLVGLLLASGALPASGTAVEVVGLIASALSAMGYSIARGKSKSN